MHTHPGQTVLLQLASIADSFWFVKVERYKNINGSIAFGNGLWHPYFLLVCTYKIGFLFIDTKNVK